MSGDTPASRLDDLARAGILLTSVQTQQGSLHAESSIGTVDRASISAAQDRDVVALEQDFARRFDPAPAVYAFAVAGSFELGMVVLFRMTPSIARSVAARHSGVLDARSVSVAIDWQLVRLESPVTIIRHELTHAMVQQIAGRDAELPAWLDEGLAEIERQSLRPDDPNADLAVAAALLASGRASLARLSTTESWLRQSAAQDSRTYSVARTAADLLTRDVGRAGIVELLERTSRGDPFAAAFLATTGVTVGAFESSFAGRVAAGAPVAWITTDLRSRLDGSVGWSARGFPASQTATVAIDGAAYHLAYPVTIDQFGMFSAAFGSTAPAGSYTVRVTSGSASASTTFWSGGAARDLNVHVRPWGTIAR